MIVDFDKNPSNSIIYTSSVILEYLKDIKNSRSIDEIFKYCSDNKMEYSMFFLSIDWLYLIGVIEKINERNELVLFSNKIETYIEAITAYVFYGNGLLVPIEAIN